MSRKSLKMYSTACSLAVLGLGAAGSAYAQQSAGSTIEEVIVTARKTEESQQAVPAAITALSQAGLDRKVVLNVQDLQTAVPGLFVAPNSQGGAPTFAIRAAKADNGSSATVATYINDMPTVSTLAIAHMMYDMDSISTLKGPQGTLFGSNSTGGAIVFRPKTPVDRFEGYVMGGLGNFNRREAEAMINIPVNDMLQVRLVGNIVRRDGFVTNHATGSALGLASSELNDDRHESARLSVRFRPTEHIQNDLMVSRFTEHDHPNQAIPVFLRPRYLYPTFLGFSVPVDYALAGITAPPGTRNVTLGPQPTFNKAAIWDLTNSTTVDLSSNLTGKLALGWEDDRLDTYENNSGVVGNIVSGRTRDTLRQFTVEPSLDYKGFDGRLRGKLGVFYSQLQRRTGNSYSVLGFPFDLSALPPVLGGLVGAFYPLQNNSFYRRDINSKAVYTQWAFDFTDKLTGTLGARYTWDKGKYKAHNYIGFGQSAVDVGAGSFTNVAGLIPCSAGLATYKNFDPVTCTGQQDFKTNSPSYSAVLEYKFAPRSMAYITARTGYLVGGFNDQVFIQGGFAQVFAPEKVKDLEAGVKSDWTLAGRPIRTNFSVFGGKYKNQQRVQNGITSTGTTFVAVQNAGRSTFYGGDAEITYNVTDALALSASYQYIHAIYDQYLAPVSIAGVNHAFVDFHGQKMSQTPDHVVNLAATYNLPLPSDYGNVSATVSYFWRSKTTGHDAPSVAGPVLPSGELQTITTDFSQYDELPSFGLVNMSVSWAHIMGSKVDLRFWAKNLFDKKYAVYNQNQLLTNGFATYNYGNPREFTVEVRYSF